MPPEGYETVTLPENLVERIDNMADEMNNPSRASVILTCLNAYEQDENTEYAQLDAGTISDIANQTSNQVVRDLESVLR